MSQPSSPKAPKAVKVPVVDTSLESWIYNIRTVLHHPSTILLTLGLLVAGTFVETVPRKVLALLNNSVGSSILFIIPLLVSLFISWPVGLLAASISLIIFARLQTPNKDENDGEEGFLSSVSDTVQSTKLVSNPHRWFVEKVLGEMPIAISSDRIQTKRTEDNDNRTSSSSSMSNTQSSDGTK